MDDRLFRYRFPRPEWLNSANTRTAGVYTSGALVRWLVEDGYLHLS